VASNASVATSGTKAACWGSLLFFTYKATTIDRAQGPVPEAL